MKAKTWESPSVKDFRTEFRTNYPHLSNELSDREIKNYIDPLFKQGKSLVSVMDLFSDYLLSQGLAEVQE